MKLAILFSLYCICLAFSMDVSDAERRGSSNPTVTLDLTGSPVTSSLRKVLNNLLESQEITLNALIAAHRNPKYDGRLGAVVAQLTARLRVLEERLQSTEDKEHGSTFVRWGSKTCPNTTALVYTGVAGGKYYGHKGSGTNTLCLTRRPQFDDMAKPSGYGYLYGAEYKSMTGHTDHDVPCSVCRVPQSTTIMVPGTLTCPPGWTTQYTGHLTAAHYAHYASEYVCLDGIPEHDSSGAVNNYGLLFYYTITQCGSLPCPPYVTNKVVTCVICSK